MVEEQGLSFWQNPGWECIVVVFLVHSPSRSVCKWHSPFTDLGHDQTCVTAHLINVRSTGKHVRPRIERLSSNPPFDQLCDLTSQYLSFPLADSNDFQSVFQLSTLRSWMSARPILRDNILGKKKAQWCECLMIQWKFWDLMKNDAENGVQTLSICPLLGLCVAREFWQVAAEAPFSPVIYYSGSMDGNWGLET